MARKKPFVNNSRRRLLQLALAVTICWTLAANTDVSATNTLRGLYVEHHKEAKQPAIAALNIPKNVQVLSPKDAALYRAVFTAQSKADWTEADRIAAKINDKALMGHVLAERYQRAGATGDQLKVWLANYKDLPQAEDIYDQAQQLPGAKNLKLTKPAAGARWVGGGDSTHTAAPSFKDIIRGKAVPSADRI